MVLRLLEQRQRLPREPLELVDRRIGLEERAVVGRADAGEQLTRLVAGRPRPLGGGVGDRGGSRGGPEASALARSSSSIDVEPRRPGQLERALEQPGGGALVAAPERAAAGGREPLARAFGERRVGLPELAACSGRPARGGSRGSRPARPAPRRAARASRRSARAAPLGSLSGARRRRRRGSAGGGSGSRPRRRTAPVRDGSAPGARARPGAASPASPPGSSACTAPRWKTSPSTAPRSSTRRSAGSSWSRRAASSAFKRRRHLDLVSRLLGHRQHLADEERVAAGRGGDPRAQLLRHSCPDQARRVLRR